MASEKPASGNTDISTLLSTAKISSSQPETMSVMEYLEECQTNKMAYANIGERILDALGEPERINTADHPDPRMARLHQSKTILQYPAFSEFYGIEDIVQQTVSFLRGHAAGSEERNQVLYFMGPVGSGKTSMANKIKKLAEVNPIYVLQAKQHTDEEGKPMMSPLLESPLQLFSNDEAQVGAIGDKFGIHPKYFQSFLSPWSVMRLEETGFDINEAFEVVKIYPSRLQQLGIGVVEPKDTTNMDIADLVGKVSLSKQGEGYAANHPDAYLYCGGFHRGNQGVVEFPEMLKAPRAALNPLLNGVQGSFQGTENVGLMPFYGLFIAHSNEDEWDKFQTAKGNEALKDRIKLIKSPYTLRAGDEAKIYEKIRETSDMRDYPTAPGTVKLLANWSVASRLPEDERYDRLTRVKVLDGEKPDGASANIPTIATLLDSLPVDTGMSGMSTRFAMKALQETYNVNYADGETAADPFLLKEVLEREIKQMGLKDEKAGELRGTLEELLVEYRKDLKVQLLDAFAGSTDDLCQRQFDRYIKMADAWLEDDEVYTETIGGVKKTLSKDDLDKKMQELERPAGIGNAKDFRSDAVRYVQRQKARTGETVKWNSYEKMAEVIRANMMDSFKDLLPALKLDQEPANEDIGEQRSKFLKTMYDSGYTDGMISRALEECDFGI